MTSFIIKAHEDRPLSPAWKRAASEADCPFCRILRGESPAYQVFENEAVIAILDIAPLRPGHILVIPKAHISRVSELPDDLAAQCGIAVSRLARAIAAALQNTALNVVCNQEYAQAVPHVSPPLLSRNICQSRHPASTSSSRSLPHHPRPQPGTGASTSAGDSPAPELSASAPQRDRATHPLTEKEMHWRELEARDRLNEDDAIRLVESIRARL
ncbi:HIT-like protein [Fomes fomentarius]|nr:HIT-like protein [Fomes fomentarius]